MMPRLYNRVAVAAAYHAHIAKLIRTLEPHLSIKQKRALKKEGKYKGQQERYPGGLDEKARPICAGYVSQMIVGMADVGFSFFDFTLLSYFKEIEISTSFLLGNTFERANVDFHTIHSRGGSTNTLLSVMLRRH